MALGVVMPALEMAQETGKIVSWLKKEGESIVKGEPLLEVETDKAVVELEAEGDGILAGITAQVGDVVPVGRTIAWLVGPGEAPPVAATTTQSPSARRANTPAPAPAARSSEAAPPPAEALISPKARRLAREHGVDISRLRGSGKNGEILAADILAAAQPSAPVEPATASGAVFALSTVGRLMAERTTRSWTSVPHFFMTREVDAGALNAARERLTPAIDASHGVKITHTDLLVALVARALGRHPRVNASWAQEAIAINHDVNVAVAIAVENAVVTAVIRHADRTGLGDIALQRRDLAERARSGRLRPADIAEATFTISNLGMLGVDAFTAIIVPPQAGILAVGAIVDRVVPVGGQIGIRPMVTLTLSSDHRVVDGARAAAFLQDVAAAIREPEPWLA